MRGTAASAAAPAAKRSNWRRRNVMRSRSVYKPAEPAKSRSGRVGMSATVHRRRTQARRRVRHRNARAALLLDLDRGREVDGSFEFILVAGRPHDPVLAELRYLDHRDGQTTVRLLHDSKLDFVLVDQVRFRLGQHHQFLKKIGRIDRPCPRVDQLNRASYVPELTV